jgi:elongator complex protein 1
MKIAAVPPPMSFCEISLEHNAVDVAFSRSSSRIAVVTTGGISIYDWDLKGAAAREPKLINTYNFLKKCERGRRIAFVGESYVYVLKQRSLLYGEIEKITLATGERTIVLKCESSDRLSFMFSSLQHDELWVARRTLQKKWQSYSFLSSDPDSASTIMTWDQSPAQETSWALASQLAEENVSSSPTATTLYC